MSQGEKAPAVANFGPFTTHQVSTMLGVSLPTVVHWCNQGKLNAHRTPGGHRRIASEDLLHFCTAHRYPIPSILERTEVEDTQDEVLIVSPESDFAELLADYLVIKGDYVVRQAGTPMVAGILVGKCHPRVLIWDEAMSGLDLTGIEDVYGDVPDLKPRIVLTADFLTVEHQAVLNSGRVFAVLQKPVTMDDLMDCMVKAMLKPKGD